MKRLIQITAVGCLLIAFAYPSAGQSRGGRYDQQIRSNVARVLLSDREYNDVSVDVEDGIVILTGSVVLDSTRHNLAARIRHILHVARVDNRLVLSPPAPLDKALHGRVISRLREAGYSDMTVQVHEGAVVLKGYVRTQKDWARAKEIVTSTPGVKEVVARMVMVAP